MHIYILILLSLSNNGQPPVSISFSSQTACEMAGDKIVRASAETIPDHRPTLKAICVAG